MIQRGLDSVQGNPITSDGVFDGAELFQTGGTGAQAGMCRLLQVWLIERDFNVRELPIVAVDYAVRPLANQEAVVFAQDESNEAAFRGANPSLGRRQLPDPALPLCNA